MKFSFWYIIIAITVLVSVVLFWFWPDSSPAPETSRPYHYPALPFVTNASDPGRPTLLNQAGRYSAAFTDLQSYLYSDKYSIFLCAEGSNEQVLVMPARYRSVDGVLTLNPAKRQVFDWSTYMASDVAGIVYPELASADGLPRVFFNQVDGMNKAEFVAAGEEYELWYSWIDNLLTIASSKTCIDKTWSTYHSH